jgi:hypothetical protein
MPDKKGLSHRQVVDTPCSTFALGRDDFPLGDISLFDDMSGLNFDSQQHDCLIRRTASV